jgi:hypothetical protein
MERKAFGGRVIFDVTGPTLRSVVIQQGFIAAVPECKHFTGDTFNLFANVIFIMSRTRGVITDIEETDPNITALANFWEIARGNANYRAVWNAFLDLPDIIIHDEWIAALNIDEQLKAPAELRPDAPDDEILESMPDGVEKKSVVNPS